MTSRMSRVVVLSFVLTMLVSGAGIAHHNMSAVYDFKRTENIFISARTAFRFFDVIFDGFAGDGFFF